MLRAGEIAIITGPPGSGKTTVAAQLASSVDRGVHLESDWFFRWIKAGFVPPHLPESHSQNTAVLDMVTDTAASYAEAGYWVAWDGIVGPWFLDRVVGRLVNRGIAVHYCVLRPDRNVALQRVSERDGTTELSGAETMWDQFAHLGSHEANVISANAEPHEVLQKCQAALADGRLQIQREAWVDQRWPVSVKGILADTDGVVVLKNERQEWELPGGRMDPDDPSPEATLKREFTEELGLDVEVGELVDSWIYDVEDKRVLIVTYACSAQIPDVLEHSHEHVGVAKISVARLRDEPMPAGYLRSIDRWLATH